VTVAPLAVTLGEPAGVGPEIIAKAWTVLRKTGPAFIVIGDADVLAKAAEPLEAPVRRAARIAEAKAMFADAIPVLHLPLAAPPTPGKPDPAAAAQVIAWIETAVRSALGGEASGVVTGPIAKQTLYGAGFKFPGHTEFIGELTKDAPFPDARGPVMMLTAKDLRVSLATIHEPLAGVPGAISLERIVATGQVTAQALRRDFGVAAPRLAVAALNPHAGESGALGDEEIRIVGPAVRALQALGIDARGPAPADSLFHEESRRSFDAALCLYHDQALIPVKMLDFWGGVNLTLGLPIVRASPDHGVALDIAGRGLARPDSLIAALRLAAEIAERRAQA
jgi:4-hydroxythreonine-4-phosphate dehydrogenase